MRRVTARLVTDPDAAEEAAREALSALVIDLPRLEQQVRDLDAWAAVVARNKAIAAQRRLDARARREVAMSPAALCDAEENGALLVDAAPDPAVCIEADERQAAQRNAIRCALDALSPEQRHAVVARLIHGRSYESIGAETGVSPALVRQRVKRGRCQLAVLYERAMGVGQVIGLGSLRELARRWRERARAALHRLAQPLDALAPTIVAHFDRQVAAASAALGLVLGAGPSEPSRPTGAPPAVTKVAATSEAPRSAAAPGDPARQPTPPLGRGGAAGGRQIASVVAPPLPYAAGGGELTRERDNDASPSLRVHLTVAGKPVDNDTDMTGLHCHSGEPVRSGCTVIDAINAVTDRG